ncbi:flagellar hook-length control protein FliK [Pseudooceanicola sp.]|uniref:flagellar hook-length control protein FliK n=1 Tax=Pseudooceanicola sp. TaxID=1914328 RepID=UPI003512B6CD
MQVAAARSDKAATLDARTVALQGGQERQIAQPGELPNPEHSTVGPARTQTGQTPPPKGNHPLPPVTQVGSPGQTRAGANGLARLDQPGGERGDAAPLRLDISGLANPTGGDTLPQKSEAGRVPTAQLVDHLLRQPERAVEISLHPRELGRVHMALAVSEHGMTLTITADRPETLDLMRRHIDQLAQEFRQLGQNEVGFAFRQGDADRQPGQDQNAVAGPLAGDAKEVAEPLHPGPVVHAGLDLRL